MSTKRLTGAERRAQLLDVGRGVFAERAFELASMDDIAQRAGISKPIVYEHFGSKEGLYAAIVEREMEELVTRVSERPLVRARRADAGKAPSSRS